MTLTGGVGHKKGEADDPKTIDLPALLSRGADDAAKKDGG
jgi:hypothetical protein